MTYGIYPEGDILILNLAGRKENHNHILRRETGFRKFFSENDFSGFEIHTLTMDQPSDKELFEKLNKEFTGHRLKGIFVTNSRVYRAASFLVKYNLKNIRLIGYDLIPGNIDYLKNGIIDFLISQKPEEQGYRGIMTLFNNIVLNRPTEKLQFIPIDIISRDNIDFYEYR
jgi:LacI family transcriptional regulator